MNNADLPASPTYLPHYNNQHEVIAWVPQGGLTKREAFAKAALQGLVAADRGVSDEDSAYRAIRHADATLAAIAALEKDWP